MNLKDPLPVECKWPVLNPHLPWHFYTQESLLDSTKVFDTKKHTYIKRYLFCYNILCLLCLGAYMHHICSNTHLGKFGSQNNHIIFSAYFYCKLQHAHNVLCRRQSTVTKDIEKLTMKKLENLGIV